MQLLLANGTQTATMARQCPATAAPITTTTAWERVQGCCGPWTSLPDASANSTGTATYLSTGLQCGGTTYAYRVWAFNAGGASAKTNEAARATPACN